MSNQLRMWHGSSTGWDQVPTVQRCKPSRYEYGPGIYMTTSYLKAKEYAKGIRGQVLAIELDPAMQFLGSQKIDANDMKKWIAEESDLRHKSMIIQRIDAIVERMGTAHIHASALLNNCVNAQALLGNSGPSLARWYASHGIDGVLEKVNMEEWISVFNPKMIKRHQKVLSRDVPVSDYDLPKIADQLICIQNASESTPTKRKLNP